MLNNIKIFKYLTITIISMVILITSCTIKLSGGRAFGYSLTGASTGGAETALILYFVNHATTQEPTLAQKLTDNLKNKVTNQTSLKLVTKEGDVTIEGSIEGFELKTQGLSGGNTVVPNTNVLTVTIKVKYTNIKNHHFDYETSFTRSTPGESATSTLDVIVASTDYTNLIDQLTDDIFQKAFVNW